MAKTARPRKRRRGKIETLPSGSLRVRVYAGKDPVTGKDHWLSEVVKKGPDAANEAEKARTRLLNQVDERRAPRTRATVGQLLDRHFELLKVEDNTLTGYDSLARIHIRPLLGDQPLGRIDGEILDSFYKELRTCRAHCRGRKYVQHRTDRPHECDDRCGPHKCEPLGDGSIRKIKAILTGAGKRARRWGWMGTNLFELAEPVPVARPNPQPPTADQAAVIANEAWQELDWGMLVWLAMMTGARRGELCALKWDRVDFSAGVLTIRSSIGQRGSRTWEKDTKTHQQRRIALDEQTVTLLRAYRRHCAERVGIGPEMPVEARIFSPVPDGSTWLKPDTVSQRYARMCARLGWDMNIHQLRHYSATELIAAGVDVRTVAGRLGHGGGGATTLRVYSAWVSEADQRAAGSLTGRMPELPTVLDDSGKLTEPVSTAGDEDESPYRRIAADLRGAIVSGILRSGDQLPTVADLAARYAVSFGTAQRAIAQLRAAGLVTVSRGRRAVVADPVAKAAGEPGEIVNLDAKRREIK
ncbi:tyrosine-type recombinase/integrase [Amycolatopsis aidingensis]|uniref:tyrosine-type recombinase/integrase n=1 Tax=Amycolatopsis aidingensis TaxID=2842453 RepID=UPI001C0D001F|nr:tyrosine-type recombinase/integrase [Amycolatopsis aidingensis]